MYIHVGQLEATRMVPARDFKPGKFWDERAGLGLVKLEQLPLESNSEHQLHTCTLQVMNSWKQW